MNESILKALMQLFAIVANERDGSVSKKAIKIVEAYLKMKLSPKLVHKYIHLFNEYLHEFQESIKKEGEFGKRRISANSVRVLRICKQINKSLQQKEKIIVLIRLIEFVNEDNTATDDELSFIKAVSAIFNVKLAEINTILVFISNLKNIDFEEDRLMVINGEEEGEEQNIENWFKKTTSNPIEGIKHIFRENLNGNILFLHIASINTFIFKYIGKDYLSINGHIIFPDRIYVFDHGSIIKGRKLKAIYYSNIAGKFLQEQNKSKILLTVNDIEFTFPNSANGIHKFSLQEESGQLIGVLGGSGTGKSTLFEILNGNIKPHKGNVKINGFDVHHQKDKLKGVIGFVPQDDLLIEELTVYQNLYYNARLCFDNFSQIELDETLTRLMNDFDLYEIRDLQVGNPLNKVISGGQRKRLNIALELMREPSLLFVDEPTSGLSSIDSENVMFSLKQLTVKGKLVLVNIHQPSSNIFKLFDKIVIIDKGGFIIYQGDPLDSLTYFKEQINRVDASENECLTCGNVSTEHLFEVIEDKIVTEYGKLTSTRRFSPQEWYEKYMENIESKMVFRSILTNQIPNHNRFTIPSLYTQFKIFSIRNLLAKLTNKQYILVNLLVAPVLAFILSFFTRYSVPTSTIHQYIFSENENVVAYLFMSVVVSLFLGMTVSAEEIIKDQKIIKREAFLNLSRFSYINSKVFLMFLMSAIQMLMYVFIGNYMLGIKEMAWTHWLILFSAACFSNLVGLNISSGLSSVVAIYILIPLILVPQMLLGGVLVRYDRLHESISRNDYVPFVGDMMVSRWAFEALAVTQFKDNQYDKHFFKYDQIISNTSYLACYLIPELETKTDIYLSYKNIPKQNPANFQILKRELYHLETPENKATLQSILKLDLNFKSIVQIKAFLKEEKNKLLELKDKTSSQRDNLVEAMQKKLGKEAVYRLKQEYQNKRLCEILLNKSVVNKILEENGDLIRKKDPVYMLPESKWGRAHFYAPLKRVGDSYFDTYWFNIIVIWAATFVAYLALQFDFLRRIINYLSRYRKR